MERLGKQRLIEEENQINNFLINRKEISQKIRKDKMENFLWERYINCNHSTNPLDRPDVNSFISIWNEEEDNDLTILYEKISISINLIEQLQNYVYSSEVSNDYQNYERFSSQIFDLKKTIQNKIQNITQYQLIFSDKFTGIKNEVLLTKEGGGYSYGLWVNLAKNPRIKDIDFNNMSIEITKVVAMTSLAIRMIISPFSSEFDEYVLLSPILTCEFFQLPSPPKKVSTYVLRQFSQLNNLQTISYPLKNINTSQSPLIFKMKIDISKLPENLDYVTIIKIDDINNSNSLISDIKFNLEESFVTFSSKTTGIFALAISKYIHFPFQYWEINSTLSNSCELFIQTNLISLNIFIDKEGLCSINEPIKLEKLIASQFLEKLQRYGINLIAPKKLSILGNDILSKLCEKPYDLEEAFINGLSDTATCFRSKCSKWNSQLTKNDIEDKRIMFLVRDIQIHGELISDDEINNNNNEEEENKIEKMKPSKWKCIQGTVKHINEVPNTEKEENYDLTLIKDTNFHQYLMPMLLDITTNEVKYRISDNTVFISETLKYLLSKLRIFSVTN